MMYMSYIAVTCIDLIVALAQAAIAGMCLAQKKQFDKSFYLGLLRLPTRLQARLSCGRQMAKGTIGGRN